MAKGRFIHEVRTWTVARLYPFIVPDWICFYPNVWSRTAGSSARFSRLCAQLLLFSVSDTDCTCITLDSNLIIAIALFEANKWNGIVIRIGDFVTLQEKEKLYVELKQILARRPGPEAAEQLQQYKWILRDKATKLKVVPQNKNSSYCFLDVFRFLRFTTKNPIKPSDVVVLFLPADP